MKYANKILYIGAGLHIEPVIHFKDTKNFVFIDSQPRNEFDSYSPKLSNQTYKSKFFSNLLETYGKYNFHLELVYEIDKNYYKKIVSWKKRFHYLFHKLPPHINPTLLIFTNNYTNQTISYYISTNIKFNMKRILLSDIESCDGLIVSGFFPDSILLQYIKKNVTFFGYTNTCYNINQYDEFADKNNIIYLLQTSSEEYFTHFYMIIKETGVLVKYDNFKDFKYAVESHKYNN